RMVGKRVLQSFEWGEDVELTLLEGGEIMLEVGSCDIMNIDDLNELIEWLSEKSAMLAVVDAG
ncbi:MAG: hypothetical protein IPI97_14925, partial [Nitrosomonas sp.]|nr:hypothetical protein [Nitrosomonas sp.]